MKTACEVARGQDLSGRTILVTGGSSGLGMETARALAITGANVAITARDLDAGEEVLANLREAGSGRHALYALDLSDPAAIRSFAGRIKKDLGAIDVLVANAGVAQTPKDRLANGLELRFATNYLGHFLLVDALLPMLSERGARLVLLGSAGHKGRPVNLSDLAWQDRDIDQRVAYGESKSALSLFAVEATRRWHGRDIFANCILPGSVVTRLQRHHTPERMAEMLRIGNAGDANSVFISVEEAAATSVWAAVAPELERVGGLVLEQCAPCQISGPDTHPYRGYELHSTDSETARLLWDRTLKLIAARGIGQIPVNSAAGP